MKLDILTIEDLTMAELDAYLRFLGGDRHIILINIK